MAKLQNIEIEVNILCSLTKDEIQWLSRIMSKPFTNDVLEEESDMDSKMRSKIFKMSEEALKKLDQKKHYV